MSICLRICGAYSYRLTRRYSTLFMIASFMVTFFLILQLYSYRHHPSSGYRRTGDFEYHPGSFLHGRQPGNVSYCNYNYGFPTKLDWAKIPISYTPEFGIKSSYRVIYNVIEGTAYANASKYNAVTYATHATPEFLPHIIEIARYWDGPISLAVYTPSYDLGVAIQVIEQLCQCYEGMNKVSLHLFYHKTHLPKLGIEPEVTTTSTSTVSYEIELENKKRNYRSLTNKTRASYIQSVREKKIKKITAKLDRRVYAPRLKFDDCSMAESKILTFRREHDMIYPINVGRNVARNASVTNYFLVSDIEMIPSEGLAPKFLRMLRKLMGDRKREEGCIFSRTAFVVPLFEVEKGEEIPRDKSGLMKMVSENRAMYFHQKICSHCQRFPGLQTWLSKSTDEVKPMLIGRREYPYHRWEPLYFGTNKDPWYSEILTWEGRQEKMTQMLELCLLQYRMVVLDGGFLCHAAVTKSGTHHDRAQRVNSRRYLSIIGSLRQRYKDRPQCKVK